MAGEWRVMSLRDAGVQLLDCEHRTPPAAEAGYPYIAIPQVKDGRLNLRDARLISHDHLIEWTHKARPQKWDVILSRRCNPGETAVVPSGLECALGQNLVLLRANGKCVLPEFLRWLVRSPEWWEQIQTFLNVGAVFDSLKCADIPNFRLPIPPQEDQRAIAHILGTLDYKIDLNRWMNETLEAMARAIFKSWFVDFDPVRAKSEGQDTGLPKSISDLFPNEFQESELGKIPRGWRVGTIDEEFNLTMGQSPPGKTYNEAGDGMPFFQGCTDFGFRFPSHRVSCTAPTRLANQGDTLVSVRAPVGDINMALEKCCIGRGVAAIRHKSGSRSYTYYAMHSLSGVFQDFEAGGTVFGCINKSDFNGTKSIIPPAQLVKRFEEIAFIFDQGIENNVLGSRTLIDFRDALLPKLLSGEIRIMDTDKFIVVETEIADQDTETLYTIGHSNHSIQYFINLLKQHGITAVADVRSSPFSRNNHQFNRDALTNALRKQGIAYVPLGKEFGARPDDPECYDNGIADFERMAKRPIFKQGIERLLKGKEKYRIALLCAEKEPLDCHRTILVCRNIRNLGFPIKHILADGSIEDHQELERRLIRSLGNEPNLFETVLSDSERIENAYKIQERKISYKLNGKERGHRYAR